MADLKLTRLKGLLIILLIWAGIYLPYLGRPKFKSEESRRVLPAVHMLETGDWIVPYVGGEPYYNKPPFINWMIGLSFIISGEQNELYARLVSAVFVLAFTSQIVLTRLNWLRLPGRVMAGIVFLTIAGIIEKGRIAEIEAVYVCLTGMAILWWLNVYSRKGSAWSLWCGPAVILACGLLTKGPLILLVFYCTVISVLVYSKDIKRLISPAHFMGMAMAAIIVGGWFFLAGQQKPSNQIINTMSNEMLRRLSFDNVSFFKWGLAGLKGFEKFLPWTLFLPILWQKKFVSRISEEQRPMFKACRLALMVSFALIILMPHSHSRYSMPVFGLASILLGWALSVHDQVLASDRLWRNLVLAGLAGCCVSALVGLVAVEPTITASVIVAGTICASIIIIRNRQVFNSAFRLCLLTGALVVGIMLQYAVFGTALMVKKEPLSTAVNSMMPDNETLYIYKPGYQKFLFYLRRPRKYVVRADEIKSDVRYVLIKEKDWDKLQSSKRIKGRKSEVLYGFMAWKNDNFRLIKLGP